MSFLTSQLRSYASEVMTGKDFVSKYDGHFILDGEVLFCLVLVYLAGVMFHISLTCVQNVVLRLIVMCLVLTFEGIFFLVDIYSFHQHYYKSPDPIQWLLVFPLIPALVVPLLFVPCNCMGCLYVCCQKKLINFAII